MLIEFRTMNHRSIRDEQVLSMSAGPGEDVGSRIRNVPGISDDLLPAIALYGANASGKSNILSALAFMRFAVIESHRGWGPDDGIPREPFAWGPKKAEPSLFEVSFIAENVKYQYGFVANDERFLAEWLYAWPNGHKQTWLERDSSEFKFGDNFAGENRIIKDITRPNALFLSAAAQHRHLQVAPIYSWFRLLRAINVPGRKAGYTPSRYVTFEPRYSGLADLLNEPSLFDPGTINERIPESFRDILSNADVGIVDARVFKEESAEDKRGRFTRIRILLKHKSSDENAWLPLEEESKGTKTLLNMAMPILDALQSGHILLVDELEASLHPSLAQKIVKLFNDKATNPKNGQVIFTTHDTNLLGTTLGEPTLRRDQVWLTEKDSEGATVLYPLTDFKPRKHENLERGYLQGRYGAIPFLGNFDSVVRTTNDEVVE